MLGFVGSSVAQNAFNLPYSQFGIGTPESFGTAAMSDRMGGVVYTRGGAHWVNPYNPASYACVGTESFVFDMGANIQLSRLRNNSTSAKDADGNVSHLFFAMPVTSWWKIGGGLMPFTNVDYQSVAQGTYGDGGTVKTVYDGFGGTSMAFIGSAFNIIGDGARGRALQMGFNVNYITGTINRRIFYIFEGNDSTHYINSCHHKYSRVGNFTFDLGLQWREPLGERYALGVGLTYKPYRNMDISDKALVYTYYGNGETPTDTVFPAPGTDASFASTLEMSHTVGIGLSFERTGRWMIAADATFAQWSGMKYTEGLTNSLFGSSAASYGPYSSYALGFEKSGSMDASSYWGRISWSAGVHVQQGLMRLMLNGTESRIDEWGASAGVSLPMRKGRSLLTLSVGYSSMGDKELLQRETITFGIGVSTCERWFVKRKYN